MLLALQAGVCVQARTVLFLGLLLLLDGSRAVRLSDRWKKGVWCMLHLVGWPAAGERAVPHCWWVCGCGGVRWRGGGAV